jgi:putative SOS response-associated peptidase YedK
MCGRATLTTPPEALAEILGLSEVPDIAPRFNIAPSQPIPLLRGLPEQPEVRRIELARWGILRPAPPPGMPRKAPWILVRVESMLAQDDFRDAALHRRAVCVVDGFYEWAGTGSGRQPFHFRRRDGQPFALASLWSRDAQGGLECALLTTTARPPVATVHDRMPIVLSHEAEAAWLDLEVVDPRRVKALATTDPAADLVVTKVGTYVNDARHEGPECLAPEAQRALF